MLTDIALKKRKPREKPYKVTDQDGMCVAALTMQQVRTLAVESAKYLRLRWDNHPRLWRDLLVAAREPDDAALEALRREAKLHFCGELIGIAAIFGAPQIAAWIRTRFGV